VPPTNTATDEAVLLQNIIARIPTVKEPDQLRELVVLAVDMVLRRTEDHPLRDDLVNRVGVLFAAPKTDYSIDCIELLLAAKEHRPPRQVLHAPEQRDEPADEDDVTGQIKVFRRYSLTLSKPVMAGAGAGLLMLVLAAGFVGLRSRSPDMPATAETAAGDATAGDAVAAPPDFAKQIADAARGVGQPVRLAGVRPYVLRGGDGATFVRIEGMPPSVCVASGLALAQTGALTIAGATPSRLSRMAIGNLCRRQHGPVAVTWKPAAQEPPPSQEMPKSEE